jgi:hypothetical protein
MRRVFRWVAIAATLSACTHEECVDTACATGPLSISASLTATGAELTITGGTAGEWFFGLSEMGATDGWTGEDCNRGYDMGGTIYQWCHPSSNVGVTLTAVPLGPWEDIVAEMDADATKTIFYDRWQAAFYVQDPTGACYVDNDTEGAYAALGCAAFP